MPYLIFKMSAMVRDQLFWNPESSDNKVKKEKGRGSCRVIERWHGLNPFGKIIDHHDNILMIINK